MNSILEIEEGIDFEGSKNVLFTDKRCVQNIIYKALGQFSLTKQLGYVFNIKWLIVSRILANELNRVANHIPRV